MLVIGVDIGGTKVAAAQLDRSNPVHPLNSVVYPTRIAEGF